KEEAAKPAGATRLQPAKMTTTSVSPLPLPDGRAVTHEPAASGTVETIKVAGAGAKVRVDGKEQPLDPSGAFTLDVQPEKPPARIEVDWPAATVDQTFHLFFDFDEPDQNGWKTNPPGTQFRAYVEVPTKAKDDRFKTASGVGNSSGGVTPGFGGKAGAEALIAWLAALAPPR